MPKSAYGVTLGAWHATSCWTETRGDPMKGKIGLVVGLGVGYVLGTRAGRERYEQIKTQWLKVWHLEPVQRQVTKAKTYVGDKAAAVPGAIWTGVVKIAKSAGDAGKTAVDEVAKTADEVVADVKKTVD